MTEHPHIFDASHHFLPCTPVTESVAGQPQTEQGLLSAKTATYNFKPNPIL